MALDGQTAEADELPEGESASVERNELAPATEASDNRDADAIAMLRRWADPRQTLNIADDLDDDELNAIGARCRREYDIDVGSRSDWLSKSDEAMRLAAQVTQQKDYPWPKASNVIFPLITTAATQFNARAYAAIVAGRNVVKGVIVGGDDGTPMLSPQDGTPLVMMTPQGPVPQWQIPPGAKQARADRIGQHMSWQLLSQQEEWDEETDKLLLILPIVGCAFRKTYFDPTWQRNMSLLVFPKNLVINYKAKSMELAPRLTEELTLYPVQVEENIRAGLFVDQEYRKAPDGGNDDDAPLQFCEQHRLLDLDGDGYPEPYIVTFEKNSSKVARIVARYEEDGIRISRKTGKVAKIYPVHYYTKYDFLPNPDGGIYGFGFGQLLKPINESVNTTLNLMIDAAHQQVVGGGFIGRGLSMNSGSVKFKLGEYKVVNTPGSAIRDAIVPMQFQGPSVVLFQLLGTLIDAGREVASVKDVLTGEQMSANMPATTTLAIIEQGLKVFTAIYKRVHRAAKKEYEKLYRLNSIYLEDEAEYQVGDVWRKITREDYQKGSGVEPYSDPSMVSDMQRLGRAQFLMQFMNDPWCNPHEIRHRVLTAASIDDIDKVLLEQPPQPAPDPMIALMAREQEIKILSERGKFLTNITGSILNLAKAEQIDQKNSLDWLAHELDVIRTQYEQINAAGQPGQPQLPGPDQSGGQGGDGGGLRALAQPSGDAVLPQIPGGMAGGPAGGGGAGAV